MFLEREVRHCNHILCPSSVHPTTTSTLICWAAHAPECHKICDYTILYLYFCLQPLLVIYARKHLGINIHSECTCIFIKNYSVEKNIPALMIHVQGESYIVIQYMCSGLCSGIGSP